MGKINALLNLPKDQDNDNLIDKTYLYAKDLSEPKYQFLIKRHEDVGIKHLNNSKTFIEHSNTMDDVSEDINEYNTARKRKVLIVFDDILQILWLIKHFKQ